MVNIIEVLTDNVFEEGTMCYNDYPALLPAAQER
jgi:hypothetical protein